MRAWWIVLLTVGLAGCASEAEPSRCITSPWFTSGADADLDQLPTDITVQQPGVADGVVYWETNTDDGVALRALCVETQKWITLHESSGYVLDRWAPTEHGIVYQVGGPYEDTVHAFLPDQGWRNHTWSNPGGRDETGRPTTSRGDLLDASDTHAIFAYADWPDPPYRHIMRVDLQTMQRTTIYSVPDDHVPCETRRTGPAFMTAQMADDEVYVLLRSLVDDVCASQLLRVWPDPAVVADDIQAGASPRLAASDEWVVWRTADVGCHVQAYDVGDGTIHAPVEIGCAWGPQLGGDWATLGDCRFYHLREHVAWSAGGAQDCGHTAATDGRYFAATRLRDDLSTELFAGTLPDVADLRSG